mmetsp:Transcript_24748/g.45445  ORF Transcript_24748/g.45445 Transcript_24748/m.45445 type:complete len:281 (-) Transcript_24748:167-1009(-)
MLCKMPGEAGRLELERTLLALGETVSWQRLTDQQWQHRCCPTGRYGRSFINWYASRGTVVCQGEQGALLERDIEQTLLGRPPVEIERSDPIEGKRLSMSSAKHQTSLGTKGSCHDHSRGLHCSDRLAIDGALRLLGEEPAWTQYPNGQQQHRCRLFGRYDQTVVNWYAGNGRIVCQGLVSAALEQHLKQELQRARPASSLSYQKRQSVPASNQKNPVSSISRTSVPMEETPTSKLGSADSSSTGTPSDDSDTSTLLLSDTEVKYLSQQFNERLAPSIHRH